MELKMMKTEKEKLEYGINKYVDSWFDGLIKSWKTKHNKDALRLSYEFVAKQAVKAYIEEQNISE